MLNSLLRIFTRNRSWVPDPGRKLIVYIGWPLQEPKSWLRVKSYDHWHLELEDGMFVKAGEVRSRLIVYSNNEIMDGMNLIYPLPPGVKCLDPATQSKLPINLEAALMEYGRTVCLASHGRLRMDAHRKQQIYATTLRNISPQRLRIQKFAGFRPHGSKYILNTVTGDYFSDQQFIVWYSASADGWIASGESVTDEHNFGGGVGLWAYFGHTEDGNQFIATASFPR